MAFLKKGMKKIIYYLQKQVPAMMDKECNNYVSRMLN